MIKLLGPALVALLLMTGCGAPTSSSSGSCVGPQLTPYEQDGEFWEVQKGLIETTPGATVTVHGYWWTADCNDTGRREDPGPIAPFHLVLADANGDRSEVGVAHPGDKGDKYGFVVDVTIPTDAPPGDASITTDSSYADHPSAVIPLHIGAMP